jgi:hypothetical protein
MLLTGKLMLMHDRKKRLGSECSFQNLLLHLHRHRDPGPEGESVEALLVVHLTSDVD